jgi:hypothetical protein
VLIYQETTATWATLGRRVHFPAPEGRTHRCISDSFSVAGMTHGEGAQRRMHLATQIMLVVN